MSLYICRLCRKLNNGQNGGSLVETAIALMLFGIISVAFLTSLSNSSKARLAADEHTAARALAQSQIEALLKESYQFSYDPLPVSTAFAGYSTVVTTDNLRNGNIQKITVTVVHDDHNVTALSGYKVNR